MNKNLEGFMAYLEAKRLVKFDMTHEGESGVITSNKLQRYVFLAKYFGLDMNYTYDIYIYGIQSTTLMGDYLDYIESHSHNALLQVIKLPDSFKSDEFLNFVKDRDDRWLEIATVLLKRDNIFPNKKHLIENVEATTPFTTIKYVTSVYNDLKDANLVKYEVSTTD